MMMIWVHFEHKYWTFYLDLISFTNKQTDNKNCMAKKY